jgi:hypothetical protein
MDHADANPFINLGVASHGGPRKGSGIVQSSGGNPC